MTMPEYSGATYLTVRSDERVATSSPRRLVAVKVTQSKPTVVDADCVVVKVRMRIPARAFEALVPSADLYIDPVQLHTPVELEVAP